ncbi:MULTISPECIES: hypothetical protein [unclassified Nostoc]|uniref:hypothetical protein n=1 Tax=unclassified Nostoc TaxID=2593658 RepID=UPI0025AABC55|nr:MULTISPECIES: hypothetical protein [unclassified Nostoc]MDM9584543.1 hypothetical protein [Nostoc sp. GT001]MDZ7946551.1 hypothetical protein [Nostoc sp. EfeVER01]
MSKQIGSLPHFSTRGCTSTTLCYHANGKLLRLPSLREAALLYETLRERLRSVTTPTASLRDATR